MVGFAVVLDALQSLILPEGLQLTRIPLIVVLGDFDQLLEIRSLFVLSILIGFNFFIQVVQGVEFLQLGDFLLDYLSEGSEEHGADGRVGFENSFAGRLLNPSKQFVQKPAKVDFCNEEFGDVLPVFLGDRPGGVDCSQVFADFSLFLGRDVLLPQVFDIFN